MSTHSREIRLASRPKGFPSPADFALATVALPDPVEGQVLVRNLFLSVDPYMRGRMNDVKSYVPPFALGAAMEGGAVGEVVASKAKGIAPGATVTSMYGWREAFVADAKEVRLVDPSVRPLSAYLGVLGVTGLTAWVGLNLGEATSGETLFVSGAAGAVGSIAGQLAKARGCRVVGSAGSAEKVRFLQEELGFDAAFDYHEKDLSMRLKDAAPDGVDVYFDNVGGEQLEAALGAMNLRGRVVMCGAISVYNDVEPRPGPRNLPFVIGKRLTIRGFIVTDHLDETPAFLAELVPELRSGRLKAKETVVEGIENAPRAFLEMLRGANVGKMVVRV
jgi:hypothetical protein